MPLQQNCKVCPNTVTYYCKCINDLAFSINLLAFYQRKDSVHRIEADESAVGGRKYHRGHRSRKGGIIWVCGGVALDRSDVSYFFARVTEQLDDSPVGFDVICSGKEDLQPQLQWLLDHDGVLVSDCWKGYDGTTIHHEKVNHKIEFVNPDGATTNHIEAYWRVVKLELKKRYQRVGTEDLFVTNDRIQFAVALVNCRLEGKHPISSFFQAMLGWKELDNFRKEKEAEPQEGEPNSPDEAVGFQCELPYFPLRCLIKDL